MFPSYTRVRSEESEHTWTRNRFRYFFFLTINTEKIANILGGWLANSINITSQI